MGALVPVTEAQQSPRAKPGDLPEGPRLTERILAFNREVSANRLTGPDHRLPPPSSRYNVLRISDLIPIDANFANLLALGQSPAYRRQQSNLGIDRWWR